MKLFKKLLLIGLNAGYNQLTKRFLFRRSAQQIHSTLMKILPFIERRGLLIRVLSFIHKLTYTRRPVEVGGVTLQHPLILAAGMVAGIGFDTEETALSAVQNGQNILPGWRAIPKLAGLVEFGSFTRYPHKGNPGSVIWRDENTRSIQHRVGLRNPGAVAAAEFMAKNQKSLPAQYGINIALSPNVDTVEQAIAGTVGAFEAFLSRSVQPTWFTLNLNHPKPLSIAQPLCESILQMLRNSSTVTPLWIKLSPDLPRELYGELMRIFAETGVQAVIATNSTTSPAPNQPDLEVEISGGNLYLHSLNAISALMLAKHAHNYPVDVIACGGLHNANTYHAYLAWGIQAVQYWSAFIYRGPLAAAIIESERPAIQVPIHVSSDGYMTTQQLEAKP